MPGSYRRSDALRAYAGDTALPGGKVDAQDATVEDTAVSRSCAPTYQCEGYPISDLHMCVCVGHRDMRLSRRYVASLLLLPLTN